MIDLLFENFCREKFNDAEPNFDALRNLVFRKRAAIDYEFIVFMNTYKSMYDCMFPFPCPVQYISLNKLNPLNTIFLNNLMEQSGLGLNRTAGELVSFECLELLVDSENVPAMVEQIAGRKRAINNASVVVSSTIRFDVSFVLLCCVLRI